jgi:hypothetical protein
MESGPPPIAARAAGTRPQPGINGGRPTGVGSIPPTMPPGADTGNLPATAAGRVVCSRSSAPST